MGLPKTASSYRFPSSRCPSTNVNNNLEHDGRRDWANFSLVSGKEEKSNCFRSMSHKFVRYSGKRKKQKIGNVLRREEMVIPKYAVFLGRGLVPNSGAV